MKRHRFSIATVTLVLTLLGSTLAANDNDDDRLFGKGRFLRRMRKEFSTQATPTSKKNKKKNSQAKGKSPTLAPQANSKSNRQASAKAGPDVSQRSGKNVTLGFGMLIESRNESLVVKTLDRRGNAAQAGIKTSDVITGIGGIEISSIEEFNQITEIMGNGDQLEFQISRKGKAQTLLIQYGIAPTESEVVTPTTQPTGVVSRLGSTSRISPASTQGLSSVMRLPKIETRRQQLEQRQRQPAPVQQRRTAPSATSGHTILRHPSR